MKKIVIKKLNKVMTIRSMLTNALFLKCLFLTTDILCRVGTEKGLCSLAPTLFN